MLRDTDLAARARLLKAVAWSVFGGIAGFVAGVQLGGILGGLLGLAAMVAVSTAFTSALAGGAGQLLNLLLHPQGNAPSRPDHSRADSLAARGMFDAALLEYELGAAANPGDAEPWLRGARLLASELRRYDEAARWYDRAREVPGAPEVVRILATREIADLHLHRTGTPRRAMPELQRLLDRHPESPAADWARRTLAELREEMLREVRGLQ